MGHALKKADRLYIPPRDKSMVAKPRAAISKACSHTGQVKNAFEFGLLVTRRRWKNFQRSE